MNYLNRFSLHLAEISAPLREICRQDVEFELTESVCVAFSRTKEEISKNVTLPYFNPKSETTLQTDASKKGLGAVILQNSKPVMFASRALTGAEKNYQNLERECLATIWGMEKFHYFLYGKQFTLETDQKPLVSIYKKHMVEISPRIQRLVVRSFPYQPFDLSMENGLITKGARLVIPSTLRRKVLEQIHEGHLGIEKCMLKARDSVFWPGISNDIRETMEKCGICQASSKAAKPVGNVGDVPPHAWHTLGTDLFYWNKIDYLVIGDYFSKYLIIRRLPNSSSHAMIKELGLVFTELGRPFVLRSDNGPCYSSKEFHNFMSFYQVDHITSSPHYPQSNGFAEALVGTAKKLMEKSVKEGKPWNYGLLQYRTTPISSTLPSPLEMLTGRKPHSSLPQLPSSVGHNMETTRICQELLRRQPTISTGTMDLEPGQPVFVKEVNGNIWRTATVDQPAAEPDSYWVRFPDNSILRRTRSMIKPRSVPSHFELQAEAQQRNFEGETNSRSSESFSQLNEQSMLPVTPMASVTKPATVDRGSKVSETPDPINSTGAPQPTVERGAISSPQTPTPRHSTRSTKGVPPVHYTPSRE